jgi:hypothetical protein
MAEGVLNSNAELALRILNLEGLAERRRLAIEAGLRRIRQMEDMLSRRDARIAVLQGDLRTARARLRRIAAIAAQRERRAEPPALRERAVGG